MRVSPICVQNSMNCCPRTRTCKEAMPTTATVASSEHVKSVSFKNGGVGAGVGTAIGIGLGLLLTAGTGGLAAPLILGITGCAAGGILGSENESESYPGEKDTYDDNGFSHYD